jgi:hypothetical protein
VSVGGIMVAGPLPEGREEQPAKANTDAATSATVKKADLCMEILRTNGGRCRAGDNLGPHRIATADARVLPAFRAASRQFASYCFFVVVDELT